MFWTLLLAHLIADYPLQTDAMVQAKKRLPGLTLHVGIHLATMVVILMGLLRIEWRVALPAVAMVTLLHFAIDLWKNMLSKRKPQWVIGGYLQDQVLHVASLLLTTYWFVPSDYWALPAPWVIYASGYVLVTHAWFVTERVITYRNQPRQQLVGAQLWPRMMSRALLLTTLLIAQQQIGPVSNPVGMLTAWLFTWPYGAGEAWPRFWLIDIAVAVVVTAFILITQ